MEHDDTKDDRGRVPIGYIGTIKRDNWEEEERAIFHSRDGNRLFLRAADPCDRESERVPLYEGDEVIVLEHFVEIGHHTTKEGTDGYLLCQRIVPTREEPGKVFARTLRFGEQDDGRRVHVRPEDELVVDDVLLEIDYVDEWEGQGVNGYVPLTPVLFSWMSFGTNHSDEKRRYLLAAARRLDQAQMLFERVGLLRQLDPDGAPAVRRAVFDLVGATELAVVSLGRVVDMCMQAPGAISAKAAVPVEISTRCDAIRQIRNAYEHIEDRAVGNVHGAPHADALTIFNHQRVVTDAVIEYGAYQLDLTVDVPETIAAARRFLKEVAGN
jgi:hypothetical protein